MSHESLFFDFLCWYLIFIGSTVLHEAAHAFAAHRLGDDTAFRGGQVTLDPTPHLKREPFGMVIIPILSYFNTGWIIGWASAPFDLNWALRYPRRAAIMAFAGPASNFLLLGLAFILMKIGLSAGIFTKPISIGSSHLVVATQEGFPYLAAKLLSILFYLNLILFLFNLLPVPPLDGRAWPLWFLPEAQASRYFQWVLQPSLSWVGMFAAWFLFPKIFAPIFHQVLRLLY